MRGERSKEMGAIMKCVDLAAIIFGAILFYVIGVWYLDKKAGEDK